MWSRASILACLCLAVTLGGCSLSDTKDSNSAGFTGTKGDIATVLNLFASDSSSTDGSDICKNVLASSVTSTLRKNGGCSTDINNQLKTIDVFTITVESIDVTGSSATARVQTTVSGKKKISTVMLTHEEAGWRVSSIGPL